MGRARNKLRLITGIVRDTTAIAKAFVTSKRAVYQAQHAVLQATSLSRRNSPPSESKLLEVISAGRISPPASAAVVGSLIDRLHRTRDAYVAMKCLYTIHAVLQSDSLVAKKELMNSGGRNFLIMATFRDKTDSDAWELSSWVRCYASVIEQELKVCWVLSFSFFVNGDPAYRKRLMGNEAGTKTTSEMISRLGTLVMLVELISDAPLSLRHVAIVDEVIRLLSYDYGITQKEILIIMEEIEKRVEDLGYDGTGKVVDLFNRLEACKGKLGSLFLNKNRHDAYWEKMGEISKKLVLNLKEITESMRLVVYGTRR